MSGEAAGGPQSGAACLGNPRPRPDARWDLGESALKLRLGEFPLWTTRFRAMKLRDLGEFLPGLVPPLNDCVPATGIAWVANSVAISERLPRLTRTDGWLRYVPRQYN